MALVLFDVLHLDGKSVMRDPWHDRRERLEDVLEGHTLRHSHRALRALQIRGKFLI
jgi:ATP-dependent DNA ligase